MRIHNVLPCVSAGTPATIGWLCFRYRTVGTVPRQGGFLIASNHASYLDSLILVALLGLYVLAALVDNTIG